MKSIYKIIVAVLLFTVGSCKDTLEVKIPTGTYTTETMYGSVASARTAMRGIYASMVGDFFSISIMQGMISGTLGISSDELVRATYDANQQLFFDNNVLPETGTLSAIWGGCYSYIYKCNALIEGVTNSTALSIEAKNALIGEARTIRAYFYFYLTNLFNKVPLALTAEYEVNRLLPASEQSAVYQAIIDDLVFAKANADTRYTAAGTRFQMNRWTATALLARVYLYQKDWAKAEEEATLVLNETTIYKLESLTNIMRTSSTETIWALSGGNNLTAGEAATVGGSVSTNTGNRLSPGLVAAFENGDQRKTMWTRAGTGTGAGTFAPFKYKTFSNVVGAIQESTTLMRLAEQYLIRAEARAKQNKLAGAISDLDVIRKRAGAVDNNDAASGNHLVDFKTIAFSNPSISQTDLVKLIYKERWRELFSEQGHRWLDAKRSGMSLGDFFEGRKPGISDADAYYPFPAGEVNLNPNLNQLN